MRDVASFAHALSTAPTISLNAVLVRIVPGLALARRVPPNFLYTSGKPNRFNPAGVGCVYFSEDEETALGEYRRAWRGTPGEHQPRTTFYADVTIRRVLDLTEVSTASQLGITRADLHAPWRGARVLTVTQRLGHAISLQARVVGIRYPSDAAYERIGDLSGGTLPDPSLITGANVVVFLQNVRAPDRLRILGPTRRPLQRWP